jgi:hypothetical protein
MQTKSDDHDLRIERFRFDLKALRPSELIRKHITTGVPVMLSEEQYFALRNVVADEFKLHPSAVILVGSSRTGFSIAPKKRYVAAAADADLDVALVSQEKFDHYWDRVFAYAASNDAWKHGNEYSEFVRMLFNGWIDPRGLPSVRRFKQATRWTTFFDSLMQSRQFGSRRISARLYRTWSRLEAFQAKAVRQCVASLGAEPHA